MARSTAVKAKLFLILFALILTLYASMPKAKATADRRNPAGDQTAAQTIERQHAILLRRGVIDTRSRLDADTSTQDLLAVAAGVGSQRLTSQSVSSRDGAPGKQLRVIQFAGAVKRRWLEQLRDTGVEIVGYVPNHAYLVRGTAEDLARVAVMDARQEADDARPIQWMGRLLPAQKIAPELDAALLADNGAADVQIELLDSEGVNDTIARLNSLAAGASGLEARENHQEPFLQRRFLNYVVLSGRLPATAIAAVAALDDVLYIEPKFAPTPQDERSLQIIAGNLTADRTQPMGVGYLNWLTAKGLNTQPDYIIDISDTGIDRGTPAQFFSHPDLLDAQGQSRVVYNKIYAGSMADNRGHGTMVASIVGGLGSGDRKDEANYLYGLGVDPKAKLGASRLFLDTGGQPINLSYTNIVSAAYAAGARISNNSWGSRSNAYDIAAQEYDGLVRDAQPEVGGNQEMMIVFSAGNGGPGGTISSPGTAKNVITVAASENYRPEGLDNCNLDGAGGVGPTGADSALDILRFSSGGPTFDFRAKPDITAPGTHVYAAASQAQTFFGEGLCAGSPLYRPSNYAPYFTWSSGTSLAAPHVTGAASLIRRYVTQNNLLDGRAPSPAMTKALLINSASYLTGENAGGSLPNERQGYGLVNLGRAFDAVRRRLVDQTHLFTESGQTFEITGSLSDRTQPLRVTLAWTDAPGSLVGAALVNDLDLEVKVGDTTIGNITLYRGNRFFGATSIADGGDADRLNNIESVIIPPEAIPEGFNGNLTITVRAANIAGNGVPNNDNSFDQDFALVVANFTDPLAPPPPPRKTPVITTITYVKKLLTISGRDFTGAARVEINGTLIEQPFQFDAATNSLSIKLKAKKLKLIPDADNRIVVIENNERSQTFVVRV